MDNVIDIKVDVSKLTLGDLEKLEAGASTKDLLDVLDKCVEGGARRLPVTALSKVTEAIREAVSGIANPLTGTGSA